MPDSARLPLCLCIATVTATLIIGPATEASGRSGASYARHSTVKRAPPKASHGWDWGYVLAIQPNGRTVVAGESSGASGDCDVRSCIFWAGFALARYMPNGRLDPSFGRGGKVLTEIGGSGEPSAIAIQRDGKIVVADEVRLFRLTPRGRLDPTFGRGGVVDTSLREECGPGAGASALALDAEGRILVAGSCLSYPLDGLVLARYTPDGRLDPSFGDSGSVLTDLAPDVPDEYTNTYGSAVAIQVDGKIVVAGDVQTDYAVWQFALGLARYMPDGDLDPSFGTGGRTLDVEMGTEDAYDVALQPDGKIVAVGFDIARYEPGGRPDRSFGINGKVQSNLDFIAGIVLQPDGKIVIAGWNNLGFRVDRYVPDGAPDQSFGRSGSVATDFGRQSIDRAEDVALQSDGKIVVAGTKEPNAGDPDFALVRYTAQGRLDRGFGKVGKVVTDFTSGITGFVSFTATRTKPGVLVRWRTRFEVETRGFHIYRERPGKPLLRVNRELIVARGNSARGAAYSLLDRRTVKGTGRYFLQEVKRDGRTINRGQATVRKAG
jgi:uncharacterized delta-60 repeat protein